MKYEDENRYNAGWNAALLHAADECVRRSLPGTQFKNLGRDDLLAMQRKLTENATVDQPTGPVTLKHPATQHPATQRVQGQYMHELELFDYEIEALVYWHRDQQFETAKHQDYHMAHDHKRRREELEKMKGGGK